MTPAEQAQACVEAFKPLADVAEKVRKQMSEKRTAKKAKEKAKRPKGEPPWIHINTRGCEKPLNKKTALAINALFQAAVKKFNGMTSDEIRALAARRRKMRTR